MKRSLLLRNARSRQTPSTRWHSSFAIPILVFCFLANFATVTTQSIQTLSSCASLCVLEAAKSQDCGAEVTDCICNFDAVNSILRCAETRCNERASAMQEYILNQCRVIEGEASATSIVITTDLSTTQISTTFTTAPSSFSTSACVDSDGCNVGPVTSTAVNSALSPSTVLTQTLPVSSSIMITAHPGQADHSSGANTNSGSGGSNTNSAPNRNEDSGVNRGVKIGLGVAIPFVLLLAIGVWLCVRRRHTGLQATNNEALRVPVAAEQCEEKAIAELYGCTIDEENGSIVAVKAELPSAGSDVLSRSSTVASSQLLHSPVNIRPPVPDLPMPNTFTQREPLGLGNQSTSAGPLPSACELYPTILSLKGSTG